MRYRDEVLSNCSGFATDTLEKKLSLGGLGVAGEAGEVVFEIDHAEIAGLPAVRGKLVKELGDFRWYLEYLAAVFEVELKAAENKPEAFRAALPLCATGIAVHSSAIADLIKKVLHHEVPVDAVREKIVGKMSDAFTTLDYTARVIGSSMAEVEAANIAKLRARHPNGWSPKSQQEKLDEKVA